jgi:UPF0042 nucleotide-binding protein
MSGAGRSQVGNTLEDLGWFVIDNLPAPLIPKVADLALGPRTSEPKVALALAASRNYAEIEDSLAQLRSSGARVRVLFLDASTDTLVRRYESTKRRHPNHSDAGLTAAIEGERRLLEPVRASADLVIDTSTTNIYELRRQIVEIFGSEADTDTMQIALMSFGFKYGVPPDVDMVIDCRFLTNPYWQEELRPLTGHDEAIKEFVLGQPATPEFVERLMGLLTLLIPAYEAEGKAYLTVAFGCTGGRHRSVAITERVAELLRAEQISLRVHHRDSAK